MLELRASEADAGKRLDAWLAEHFPMFPRAAIRRVLEAGEVRFAETGHRCAKGDRVCAHCTYRLLQEPHVSTLAPNADLGLTVLYEDADLVAVNKPAGQDCQPQSTEESGTLANALLACFPEVRGVGDTPLTCGLLHRIDHDTSGLILVARSQGVYDALRAQFSAHTVEKHYQALVSGKVTHPGHLEHQLAHNPRCPGRMVDAQRWHDAKRPMRAVTDYRPLRHLRLKDLVCTLLDVTIYTGVTHQIRAQLAFSGLPIVGDRRYGGAQIEGFSRHFLHADSATFRHPGTRQAVRLSAPLTDDLAALLARATPPA